MTEQEVLELVKKRVVAAGSGRKFAASCGISQPYFSQMVTGSRPFSSELLRALEIERVTSYRKVKAS